MEHPLKRFRQGRALTIEKAAKELDVSKATLSRIENGKQKMSSDLLQRIAAWTNGTVTPNDLLGVKRSGRAA